MTVHLKKHIIPKKTKKAIHSCIQTRTVRKKHTLLARYYEVLEKLSDVTNKLKDPDHNKRL